MWPLDRNQSGTITSSQNRRGSDDNEGYSRFFKIYPYWGLTMRLFCFLCRRDHSNVKESNLPNYLVISGGRIMEFIYFPGVLALYEMNITSPRIWIRVTDSTPYKDKCYPTSLLLLPGQLWLKTIVPVKIPSRVWFLKCMDITICIRMDN